MAWAMVVGAATWFPVYFFPVVRFAASDAWVEAIWVIAVPLLWLLCIVQVFGCTTILKSTIA